MCAVIATVQHWADMPPIPFDTYIHGIARFLPFPGGTRSRVLCIWLHGVAIYASPFSSIRGILFWFFSFQDFVRSYTVQHWADMPPIPFCHGVWRVGLSSIQPLCRGDDSDDTIPPFSIEPHQRRCDCVVPPSLGARARGGLSVFYTAALFFGSHQRCCSCVCGRICAGHDLLVSLHRPF